MPAMFDEDVVGKDRESAHILDEDEEKPALRRKTTQQMLEEEEANKTALDKCLAHPWHYLPLVVLIGLWLYAWNLFVTEGNATWDATWEEATLNSSAEDVIIWPCPPCSKKDSDCGCEAACGEFCKAGDEEFYAPNECRDCPFCRERLDFETPEECFADEPEDIKVDGKTVRQRPCCHFTDAESGDEPVCHALSMGPCFKGDTSNRCCIFGMTSISYEGWRPLPQQGSVVRTFARRRAPDDGGGGGCFSADTQVRMKDGSTARIDSLRIGDATLHGEVTGTMQFRVPSVCSYRGVRVAPGQAVQTPGGFVRVADIAECDATQEVVYDIDVEPGHRISVDVDGTEVVFADFAELPYTHAVYQQEAAALLGALNAEALGQDSLAV